MIARLSDYLAIPGRFAKVAKDLLEAARRFDIAYPAILFRAIRLWFRRGFYPREALRCGLFDPRVSADAESGCISKQRLINWQRRFNPRSWECLSEDKSVFYAYCSAVGLPVPALFAVFDFPVGWSSTGMILRERKDWEQFFDEQLPNEFVVKPAAGVYGLGVNVYQRVGRHFQDAFGVDCTASTLYETLRGNHEYRRFVIQERLRSHADLEQLSGTTALQTARLVTWVGMQGDIEIYLTLLKIIAGNRLTDNYQHGRSGNLIANIDAEKGVLGPAIGGDAGEFGFRTVDAHPSTNAIFSGFQLPFWQEARELVRRAAGFFCPLRTIGWDVALTPHGPVLVEANMWWNPFNDLVIGPQASDNRRGGMAILLKHFETETNSTGRI